MRNIFKLSLVLLLLLLVILFTSTANAATNYYVPSGYYPINAKSVSEGSIISFANKGYILSTTEYDQYMVGVVTSSPAIIENIQSPFPSYPVISSGEGFILVSTINGTIKKGDFITSSKVPGVGMKATIPGYTLGVALEDYAAGSTKAIGKIPIQVNIHYYVQQDVLKTGLANIANLTILAAYQSPSIVFKYLVAAGVISLALLFGFILISRTANKGIEALGRNPLSTTDIHIAMILNIFIALLILVAGFVMAIIVLRL